MAVRRFHIIIDISDVDNKILSDKEGLSEFLKTFPAVIGMHVLKGPEIAEGIPENPGLSGFVIIDFSHISVHTFTNYHQALVDIFSCKTYDQKVATDAVLHYFHASLSQATTQQVSWE